MVIDDDGPGISESEFERVFAPFVRLEGSRSPETGGIGLGMAIARSIVRGHGGEITLHNRREGGLRVAVRLPLADAA
ncbi:MAG: histidine kinase [Geminicoccaceae bacterium]|nr:histidine kinase [Geminicoccaceae bacterium]